MKEYIVGKIEQLTTVNQMSLPFIGNNPRPFTRFVYEVRDHTDGLSEYEALFDSYEKAESELERRIGLYKSILKLAHDEENLLRWSMQAPIEYKDYTEYFPDHLKEVHIAYFPIDEFEKGKFQEYSSRISIVIRKRELQ